MMKGSLMTLQICRFVTGVKERKHNRNQMYELVNRIGLVNTRVTIKDSLL